MDAAGIHRDPLDCVLCGKKKDGRPCLREFYFPFSADFHQVASAPLSDHLRRLSFLKHQRWFFLFDDRLLGDNTFGDGRLGGEAIIDFEHCFLED